jgi:putative phage-type endonuclease
MKRYMSPTPGSDAWVALRRSGIGATDAPVVCGRSPFRSPFDKFVELSGTSAPIVPTSSMLWGIRLQPVVAQAWAEEHGRKVKACRYIYELEPGIFSSYDYEVVPPKGEPVTELVEVKTTSQYAAREYGEPGTDQVPEGYFIQCQHEMACRPGILRVHLAVLIGGQKLQSYIIERVPEMIEDLLRIERRALANARAGIPPEMDGSEAATNYLRGLSPRDNGERWDLPEPVEALATAYLSAREQEKSVVEQKETLANRLRQAMGDHALATGRSVKVSYKNSKDTDWVDWRACAETTASDEIIAKFTSTRVGNRPLIVTPLEAP